MFNSNNGLVKAVVSEVLYFRFATTASRFNKVYFHMLVITSSVLFKREQALLSMFE